MHALNINILYGTLIALVVVVIYALIKQAFPAKTIPLARTFRLTDLPGYATAIRILRLKQWSILIVTLLTAISAGYLASRPAVVVHGSKINPEITKNEIMVCDDQRIDSPVFHFVVSYFQNLADNPDNVMGITSGTTRFLPLTAQNWFAHHQFKQLADVYGTIKKTKKKIGRTYSIFDTPDDVLLLRSLYNKDVDYTDYSKNYLDTVGLCVSGFPPMATEKTKVTRSLLYCGPTRNNSSYHTVFNPQSLEKFARKNFVKLHFLDGCENTPGPDAGKIKNLARNTQGSYTVIKTAHIPQVQIGKNVTSALHAIFHAVEKAPDSAASPQKKVKTTDFVESPNLTANIALALLTVLVVLRMWVRR